MKENRNSMKEASDALWSSPSRDNWVKFSKILKSGIKSNTAKYYRITPEEGKDIKKSCAEILDPKEKTVAKVPGFVVSNGKAADARAYLKGLTDIREKEKEYLMQRKLKALGYM
jgi:hypothetical protein